MRWAHNGDDPSGVTSHRSKLLVNNCLFYCSASSTSSRQIEMVARWLLCAHIDREDIFCRASPSVNSGVCACLLVQIERAFGSWRTGGGAAVGMTAKHVRRHFSISLTVLR